MARPVTLLAAVAAVAMAAVLALSTPVAAQVGVGGGGLERQTTEPTGPGIGEAPGGGRQTTDPDRPRTTEGRTTTTEKEPGSTASTEAKVPTAGEPAGTGTPDDDDDDEGGTSIVALAAVGLVGVVVGVLLAAIPLGAALSRRKRPAPPSPYAAAPPGGSGPPPAPVATPPAPVPAPVAAGPVVGPAPSRDEAQARSQRAALAEALMDLRDQLPSAALGEEAARSLASVGITEIRPDGQPFDPSRQRAVDQVATDDPARHNTVVSTERPGYADGDRIVRLPEVVVARHEGAPS